MRIIIAALMFFLSGFTHANDSMKMLVDPQGAQFQVSLPANPTTGYQWTVLQYDSSRFQFVKSKYLPGPSKRIGSGGNQVFTFKLVAGKKYPKKTNIKFKYARSWEKDHGTLTKVAIQFSKAALQNKKP